MDCESCTNYVYDENTDEYICECDLDEDDYAALAFRKFKDCPFYRYDDEYSVVKKQN